MPLRNQQLKVADQDRRIERPKHFVLILLADLELHEELNQRV